MPPLLAPRTLYARLVLINRRRMLERGHPRRPAACRAMAEELIQTPGKRKLPTEEHPRREQHVLCAPSSQQHWIQSDDKPDGEDGEPEASRSWRRHRETL